MIRGQEPVICVVPGDLHLTEPDLENHRTALWMVHDVNDLIRPDFVQFIGDNVQDATETQFRIFQDLVSQLRVPWYAVPGDHDVQDDLEARKFQDLVGKPYGALSLRGFRFLRLNTQEARPVGLSPEQVTWFRQEFDAGLASDERVVIFQHNYPYKVWESFAGPGVDAWREIVQSRRVTAIFTGHTHYGQMANDGRNVVITTRSIGDAEGGPPGYSIIYMHGDDLAVTYRSVEDQGPIALITHPRERLLATGPAHVIQNSDVLRLRVWSIAPLQEVSGRLDDDPWAPLMPAAPCEFATPLIGDLLTKGEHRFEVRAIDVHGKAGRQSIEFAVDATGRYTAVPDAKPRVARTCFC